MSEVEERYEEVECTDIAFAFENGDSRDLSELMA
jgi:hypothetical protein